MVKFKKKNLKSGFLKYGHCIEIFLFKKYKFNTIENLSLPLFWNYIYKLKWLYAARPAAHCLPLVANQIEDSVKAAPESAADGVMALLASILA